MTVPIEVACRGCPQYRPYPSGARCGRSREPVAVHVAANACPIGRFGPTPRREAQASSGRPCPKCVPPCLNCGSLEHAAKACLIPADYDGDYRNDTGGSAGCNCA